MRSAAALALTTRYSRSSAMTRWSIELSSSSANSRLSRSSRVRSADALFQRVLRLFQCHAHAIEGPRQLYGFPRPARRHRLAGGAGGHPLGRPRQRPERVHHGPPAEDGSGGHEEQESRGSHPSLALQMPQTRERNRHRLLDEHAPTQRRDGRVGRQRLSGFQGGSPLPGLIQGGNDPAGTEGLPRRPGAARQRAGEHVPPAVQQVEHALGHPLSLGSHQLAMKVETDAGADRAQPIAPSPSRALANNTLGPTLPFRYAGDHRTAGAHRHAGRLVEG